MDENYSAPKGLYPKLVRVLKPSGSGPSLADILFVAEELEKIFPEAKKEVIIHTNRDHFAKQFDEEAEKFLGNGYFEFAGSLARMNDWLKKYKALGGDNHFRSVAFFYLENIDSARIRRKRTYGGFAYRLKKKAKIRLQNLLDQVNELDGQIFEKTVQKALAPSLIKTTP